jgi:hypothetical protein
MRRPTIATMDNGLPVQCLSERDFLFPDADEKYVPDVLAYTQSYDFKSFNALLWSLRRSLTCRTVKKASPAGRCSTNGPSALRKDGEVCHRTSWNG